MDALPIVERPRYIGAFYGSKCAFTVLPVRALKRRYNSGPKSLKAVKQGPYSRELGGRRSPHIPKHIPLIKGSVDP